MAAPPTPSRHTDQALAAAGTCGFSALAVLMAGTLMLSIGGLVALGFVLALGSGAIAAALGLMALCLTLAALLAGMLSTAAAGTYASLATAQGTLRLLSGLVAPGGAKGTGVPASQPARLKELPRESPAREAIGAFHVLFFHLGVPGGRGGGKWV